MRWRTVCKCIEEEAEALAQLLLAKAERFEEALLNILAVDSNAARTQFVAIQHKVVALRTHFPRREFELFEIFINDSGERMLCAHPRFIGLAPFEQREPGDPEEFPLRLVDHAERFAELQTQLSGNHRS